MEADAVAVAGRLVLALGVHTGGIGAHMDLLDDQPRAGDVDVLVAVLDDGRVALAVGADGDGCRFRARPVRVREGLPSGSHATAAGCRPDAGPAGRRGQGSATPSRVCGRRRRRRRRGSRGGRRPGAAWPWARRPQLGRSLSAAAGRACPASPAARRGGLLRSRGGSAGVLADHGSRRGAGLHRDGVGGPVDERGVRPGGAGWTRCRRPVRREAAPAVTPDAREAISMAASTKPVKSGWGRSGRLRNSGWNWLATNQGWSRSSTISTRRPSGDWPERMRPERSSASRYWLLTSKRWRCRS